MSSWMRAVPFWAMVLLWTGALAGTRAERTLPASATAAHGEAPKPVAWQRGNPFPDALFISYGDRVGADLAPTDPPGRNPPRLPATAVPLPRRTPPTLLASTHPVRLRTATTPLHTVRRSGQAHASAP